jgi:hypothetical protein
MTPAFVAARAGRPLGDVERELGQLWTRGLVERLLVPGTTRLAYRLPPDSPQDSPRDPSGEERRSENPHGF